jgi:hypothetical protein
MKRKALGWAMALAVVALAFGVAVFRPATEAQQPAAVAGGKYTVVDTQGTNLIVVDNVTNMLYFYTVEPGKEVGADLQLRGSLDLNDVGKPVLKPKKAAK